MKNFLRTIRMVVMAVVLGATPAVAAQSGPPSFEVGKTYAIVMMDDDFMIEVLEVSDGPWIRVRIDEEDLVVWLNTNAIELFLGEIVPLGAQPTEGRRLEMGQTVSGRLDPFASLFDGRPVQAWALEAEAGTGVRIVMRSDDFDTYLFLDGPGLGEPRDNDDGADGTNSRIEATLPVTGTYTVVASAYRPGMRGEYTLTVTRVASQAQSATMRSDLRNLMTAQESYFADNVTYFGGDPCAWRDWFSCSAGVSITILSASQTGWNATARHSAAPDVTCAVFIGNASPPAPARREGEVACE